MWGSREQDRPGENVDASYADPRASLLVGCLEQSTWTETVRLVATADKICSWLARQPDVRLDSTSDYTGDWSSGTAHFRFQLLEVPPLDRKNAAPWNVSRRWRKQPHRFFVACLLSVEQGETEGMLTVNRTIRRMAAELDGELQIVSNYDAGTQAIKREMKSAHALPLAGISPSVSVPTTRSTEEDAIEAELTSVPMSSAEKPDINGYREGERVRLVNAFVGERGRYEVVHEGTVLDTNTSPADVRLCRDGDLHEILMDGGSIVMTAGRNLEKMPGHAEVVYSADGERVHVNVRGGSQPGGAHIGAASTRQPIREP
jgi:hypothetical protein